MISKKSSSGAARRKRHRRADDDDDDDDEDDDDDDRDDHGFKAVKKNRIDAVDTARGERRTDKQKTKTSLRRARSISYYAAGYQRLKDVLVLNIRNPLQCRGRRFRIELQPLIGV